MTSTFSQVESFAPILQEPVWQQQRELEALSVEARIRLAYERAQSLSNAIGEKSYPSFVVRLIVTIM